MKSGNSNNLQRQRDVWNKQSQWWTRQTQRTKDVTPGWMEGGVPAGGGIRRWKHLMVKIHWEPCSCAQQIPRGAPASLSPWGQHCPHKPGRMDRLLWISTEPARGLSSRTHHRGETALCCWVSRWICLIATGCSPSQVSKNYLPGK